MAAGFVCAAEARFSDGPFPWGGGSIPPAAASCAPASAPRLTAWQLSAAKRFMLGRLSQRLSIGDVASALDLSKSYFVRSFTNVEGVAPYSWLVAQRIKEASALLTRTTIPLAQIALECGFTDQSHFTNAFSRRVGTTPSRWRKGADGFRLTANWDHQGARFPRWTAGRGLDHEGG